MGDNKVRGEKYYSIYITPEDQEKSKDVSTVVVGFKAAGEILKRNPKARFRCASTEAEGWSYLEDEAESRPLSSDADDILVSKINKTEEDGEMQNNSAIQKRRKGRLSLPAMNSQPPKVNLSSPSKDAEEKDTRFPTPKVQELTGMAAAVRQKRNDTVIKQMDANPKLLVNDCDLPPTVQHGCHYNILHVAALANNYEIITYVLNKVGSRKFMMELYPKKTGEEIDRLIKFVTDGYLNTPDKIANETPLHCAAKFMGSESVAVLLSHPWCKWDIVNAYNETPMKVIGTRATADSGKVVKIKSFFENWYIVPIWRDSFGCGLPEIGPIAHIRDLKACTPPSLMKNFPDFNVNLLGPCKESLTPKKQEIGHLPLDNSSWKIEAYAGPTSKEQAEELLTVIRFGGNCGIDSPSIMSPRTSEYSMPSTPVSTSNDRATQRNFFQSTPRRRKLSGSSRLIQSFATPPSSPSRNSGSFITSPPALELSYHRRTDIEKGLERHARQIAMDYNVPWVEHWKCLHFFGDIRLDEGLSNLEQFLKSKESEMVLNSSHDSDGDDDNNNLSLEEGPNSNEEDFVKSNFVEHRRTLDEFEDDDSEGSFHSARSNESGENLFLDCRDKVLFIDGERPGKSDRQVYAVLKEYGNDIDANKYPLVFQWLNTIQLGLGAQLNANEEHKSGAHDMSDLAASFFNLRID